MLLHGRQWNGCPASLPEANPYFCFGLKKSEFEAMYSASLFIRVCSTTLIYWYDLEPYSYYFTFLSRRLLSCSESIQSITGAKTLVSEYSGEDWNC